jgi:DNA-directed RNA polymerase subunit RPC12/RpoP
MAKTKPQLIPEIAPKITYEFRCTVCNKYFDIKLNPNLNGNYRVHCPNCQHTHYRNVKNGKITDIRFTDNQESPLIEDLRPMKAIEKLKNILSSVKL